MKELKTYSAAVYCRLSKQDRTEDGNRADESNSIKTQRDMLGKYAKDKGWKIYDYYVDEDYTGTNFKRPNFERMLEDIESGAVNMVVVKDLSRLGRSHIETDTFMEIFFPSRNVRVIVVDENIDTIKMDENNSDIVVPMKNMLNELYSRDLSRKVRSAVRTKKRNGEFLSNYAPIGYQKDPRDKHRLIIEETGARIVRRIFEMARADMGSRKICNALTNEGVPTPLNHRNWLLHGATPQPALWKAETVIAILHSRVYLGETVQGVYDCARFKRMPTKRKPQNEWIITPNTHEPLIDHDTWKHVQKMIDARNRPIKSDTIQLFAGFVKCKDCGKALGYSNSQNIEQYTCGTYRRNGRKYCSSHYIRKDVLEKTVLDDIRRYSKLAKHDAKGLSQRLHEQNGDRDMGRMKELSFDLARLTARNSELNTIMKRLYEDHVSGKLSDERIVQLFSDYEKEQTDVQAQVNSTQEMIDAINTSQMDIDSWIKLIRSYTKIRKLSRTILGELVDKITVGEAKGIDGKKTTDITIYYRFVGAIN